MSIDSPDVINTETGAGAVLNMDIPGVFYDNAQIKVYKETTETEGPAEALLVLTTDYTITKSSVAGSYPLAYTGSIATVASIAATEKITVMVFPPFTQSTDYDAVPHNPAEYERSFDLQAILAAAIYEITKRAPRLPLSYTGDQPLFPEPVDGEVLMGRADGKGWEAGPDASDITTANASAIAAAASAASAALDAIATAADVVAAAASESAAAAAQAAAEAARDAALAASESMAWGYEFDTGTADADPGSAMMRFNHATFMSATFLYINETADEGSIADLMDLWDDSTSVIKATARIRDPLTTDWIEFQVSGAITDAGTYRKIPITPVGSNGSIADGTAIKFQVIRNGDAGTGSVDSFNTRTGPVLPAASDYDADQIDFTPAGGLAATDVQAALEELDAEKQADLDVPSQAEAEAGAATDERVWTAERIKQAIAALASGGDTFAEGAEQTLTMSSTMNVAHGLGAAPTIFGVTLICKTTDLGWPVGKKIHMGDGGYSSLTVSILADATNISLDVAGSIAIQNSSHAVAYITPANWKWIPWWKE